MRPFKLYLWVLIAFAGIVITGLLISALIFTSKKIFLWAVIGVTLTLAVTVMVGLWTSALLLYLLLNAIVLRIRGQEAPRIPFKSALLFLSLLYLITLSHLLVHGTYSDALNRINSFLHDNSAKIADLQSTYSTVNIPLEYNSLVDRLQDVREQLTEKQRSSQLWAFVLTGILFFVWGATVITRSARLKRGGQLIGLILIIALLAIPVNLSYQLSVYANSDLGQAKSFSISAQSSAGMGSRGFQWDGIRFPSLSLDVGTILWAVIFWGSPYLLMFIIWMGWKAFDRIRKSLPLAAES